MGKIVGVAYITEPSTIEIERGVAEIRDRSGDAVIRRSMSVRTLERTLERVQRALEEYARGRDHVIIDD